MKRKALKLTFILCFLSLIPSGLNAQNDAFFYCNIENRSSNDVNTFGFNVFGGDGNFENDLGFGNFNLAPDNVPLESGLLLLTAFSLFKLRKRNNK